MSAKLTWELAFQKAVDFAHLAMLRSILGIADHLAELFDIADTCGSVRSTWKTYFPEDGTKSASIT
jgi:hypothetical protein